jgi:DNA-binding transcriptional regulator YhcF (GntR family)
MRYEKGSFVVIPNKQHLKGRPAEMQSIYFWICEHANENGQCFPTRKTLAIESGSGLRTLDKYLKLLVKEGFLSVIQRNKVNSKEKTSNLYQILIIEEVVSKRTQPSVKKDTTPSVKKDAETISNINSNYLTENLSEYNSLLKNKSLVKQRLRVNLVNDGYIPSEEQINDDYETLLQICRDYPNKEIPLIFRMFGFEI